MPEIRSPATVIDLAEMSGAVSMLQWIVAKEMCSGGESFTLWHDEQLLGLFGIYPAQCGALGECWFNIRQEAAPHMLYLVRQIRLTLMASSYPELVTVIQTPAGRRIAQACGFSLFERSQWGDIYGKIVRRRR